jgi:hypothetical protein
MNLKLSTVLALVIVVALPSASLYAWQMGRTTPSEDEMAAEIAMKFLKNAPTCKFDGILGTMKFVETRILESYPVQYVVVVNFDCRQAGYGDRAGQILAQVITSHTATVRVVNGEVVSAVLDDKWDELNQVEIEEGSEEPVTTIQPPEFGRDTAIRFVIATHEELEGLVASSEWETKDLTPEGLLGASKLQYIADGWTVIVSYPVVWKPTYTVEIDFDGEVGFHWKGTVDQAGTVIETEFELKG